jgi:hypothetical protein
MNSGSITEYRSDTEFLGWPLLHWRSGFGPRNRRSVARGWIAVGPRAVGGVAIGGMTLGVLSLGGLSAGVVSSGGMTLGLLLAFGGVAGGGVAYGGLSAGHTAVGGVALGYYAMGGGVRGVHVIDENRRDPAAVEHFYEKPWLSVLLPESLRKRANPQAEPTSSQ